MTNIIALQIGLTILGFGVGLCISIGLYELFELAIKYLKEDNK